MRKKLGIVILGCVAAAAGGWWYFGKNAAPPPAAGGAMGPVAVEVAKVTVGPMAREITSVGSLRSDEAVVIRPEIAGRVKAIGFEEGSRVTKGQVLLRLDDSSLSADLVQAQANLALSRANSDRAVRLAGQGAGTERARDEAEAKLRVDQAKVEQARAQLDKTVLVAPFAGTVGLRTVSVGAYVQPGQDIVNLEATDPIKVDFRVPEIFSAVMRTGIELSMTTDSHPGRQFTGTVYAIDPAVDQNGRAIVVRARVANGDSALRPGQFVRLVLKVDEVVDALTIPEEALVPRGQQIIVFRIVDGKAQPGPVKTGRRARGLVEVTEGLKADDTVVTAGQMKLRPGVPVAVPAAPAPKSGG
ncbi:efflux RND transporter periplasmic adaptor subunit [Magnetospirillum gryphiswaldense]|nr:efflux RND transporter periplasmic adaptor subunit [Magnetospirillum gryphiswaldense]AVM73580.1 Multidrug resistance protein MdtA precursor [Magnetospirillum gryphiswaldense MSR-1]AVM77483.1 Multidrug resistance protein MdtA precursor [Magnetospirillum gryphiswaldense]